MENLCDFWILIYGFFNWKLKEILSIVLAEIFVYVGLYFYLTIWRWMLQVNKRHANKSVFAFVEANLLKE